MLSNLFTGPYLPDMECCYKVFRRETIQKIEIQENRFGVEPELVTKVARMGIRIVEKEISYTAKTNRDGKKIGIRDGIRAIWCILRYNGFRPKLFSFLII
jgi:hypothetical protein